MSIRVYHRREPTFDDDPEAAIRAWRHKQFVEVAKVDTDELDVAYERTNTIDRSWWTNTGLLALVGPCRSTSVGDILKTADGKAHLCCNMGWAEIDLNGA